MKGLPIHLRNVFADAFDKIRTGQLRTLVPFLSLFRLNGKPMNLNTHYQFLPMFTTIQSPHTVWMCARQVGKSMSLGSSSEIRSSIVPEYHTLIVQPRADQIQRFNRTVYQPIMKSCPIQEHLISSLELGKLSLKTYNNGSLTFLEHMLVSPDRLRGIGNAAVFFADEAQDLEYEYLSIAEETMSASLYWGFSVYTGTPKTTDTTLALLWDRSSRAEWVIRCGHCGHFNVPNPEQDLIKMVGKHGPVCAKCGKPVNIHDGGYVHAIPERMHSFPGYHISQTIHPLHSINDNKWSRLLDKINSYDQLTLYNEVFGWPYDAATSPLTMADLQRTTHDLKPVETPADVRALRGGYRYLCVGVDWGGGGVVSDSYTAYAVLGLRKDSDVIDVLYGRRIPKSASPTDETNEIMDWIVGTRAEAFAFDNGGAGFARLEMMKQAGLMDIGVTVCPINYVSPRSGDVMRPHTRQREVDLYYYSLDKSRSLAICITALKSQKIRLPKFQDSDEGAYQRDFLALREDPSKTSRNEVVILIRKKPGVPDDFAHAVNFGCSQIWDHHGAYPRLGQRYDTSLLYDEKMQQPDDFDMLGPRGDFDRFADAVDQKASVIEGDGWW